MPSKGPSNLYHIVVLGLAAYNYAYVGAELSDVAALLGGGYFVG